MNRLLGANLARLIKDKILWIGVIAMAGLAGLMLATYYKNSILMGVHITIDEGFFNHMQFVGVIIASFCSMFVGTEYHNGTIRNKIIVGHLRSSVYLSNLITVIISGIFAFLAYIIVFSIIGIPVFGIQDIKLNEFMFYVLVSIMVIASYSSLFTMLSMCIQNRTIVMNISIILFFVLIFVAVFLYSGLSEPPVLESYIYQDDAGNIITEPETVNTFYVSGLKRKIYIFLFDFLPSCQGMQLSSVSVNFNWCLPLYSLIISALTTTIGLLAFSKKDIK